MASPSRTARSSHPGYNRGPMTSTLRVIVLAVLVSACATTPPKLETLRGAMAGSADRLVIVVRDAAGHPVSFRFRK
jgi:hypothetical protein